VVAIQSEIRNRLVPTTCPTKPWRSRKPLADSEPRLERRGNDRAAIVFRSTISEELLNGVVAQNPFDVVNENLLSASRIGLFAQEGLGRAGHAFGHR
jgi:hypothetical protein